jgi:hypothetical protein
VRFRDIEKHREDIEEMAQYLRERFVRELEKWPKSEIKVLDYNPQSSDTVVLELAIVELVPTASAQNAAASVAGLFVPGGGLLGIGASGSIAIEGRITDSATGEILVEFADRAKDKAAPVDLAGFKWYSRSKENIDDWAKQFAELAHTPPGHKVKGAWSFTLMPF